MFHNLIILDYMFIKDRLFASLNLDDKDYKLLYKIVDKIACIRYRNILANKSEYQALLDRQWIG